jgi:hypothetical protein
VVQSWLASVVYGVADELAGLDGVRLVMGALTVAIFAVVWRLTRGVESLLPRVAIGGLIVGVAASEWSERPLLVGLLAFALTILAAEGGLDPRWLLPVGWIWVNSHGTFPLGVGFLVVAAVGRRLDVGHWEPERRALAWLGGGILLGALNPLGPRLLLFPIELLQRQDVLREVIEWQAPSFQGFGERVFLLQVVLSVLALAHRPSRRSALLVAVFLAAALLGSRNISVASLVFVPVLAAAAPRVGTLRSADQGGPARLLAAGGLAATVVVTAWSLGAGPLALEAYPVTILERLEHAGVDLDEVRMVAPDLVGNLLTVREGAGTAVFVDDRFDMYPEDVLHDALSLTRGRPESLRLLDRYDADLVLLPRAAPLRGILVEADGWRERTRDEGWVLYCRRGAVLGGDAGTC